METYANGVRISYDDLGRGEPALLMMPGWCANRTMFKHLEPLASASRRTLALDWRGHGESGTVPNDFGERDLVNDALAVIEASGAQSIIPVATAHSGWVALELRRRLGNHIPKLVLLDWIILEAPAPFVGALQAFQDPAQWKPAREQLFSMWLEGVDHPEVIHFVREEMGAYGFEMWGRAGREILASYTQARSPLKALSELHPPVPTLHLYSQPADPGYLAVQEAFAAEHLCFPCSFTASHMETESEEQGNEVTHHATLKKRFGSAVCTKSKGEIDERSHHINGHAQVAGEAPRRRDLTRR